MGDDAREILDVGLHVLAEYAPPGKRETVIEKRETGRTTIENKTKFGFILYLKGVVR